ncbi:MAG TPA: 6-pyruvoyl-tetrahydropterin synthase-related protein, partial [Candidatus Sulfotelmatobacter sp.]|nr:6-pyruvoyl-tetrahydropterin synthase-related protein [Candidatus Sulfotelmatobacter sp.]
MKERAWPVDLAIFLLIYLFLFSFFDPRLLLSLTTTAGGDTGSHYYTAVYLKNVLLPSGKIMGWLMGNYAGFPLFYHYFPLPFIIMALLGFVIPLQIAFKLVSVLGIFLLPLCVYLAFRLLEYEFPVPIGGAVLTLPFLFMEANSMWGANIPSTLAGEISYGLGISLCFLFFGSLYAGLREKKYILGNAGLLFLL